LIEGVQALCIIVLEGNVPGGESLGVARLPVGSMVKEEDDRLRASGLDGLVERGVPLAICKVYLPAGLLRLEELLGDRDPSGAQADCEGQGDIALVVPDQGISVLQQKSVSQGLAGQKRSPVKPCPAHPVALVLHLAVVEKERCKIAVALPSGNEHRRAFCLGAAQGKCPSPQQLLSNSNMPVVGSDLQRPGTLHIIIF
jgi:hypothetical protein